MCQCSENSYFWRVIDHKYQAPCWIAWCTVLTKNITKTYISAASYILQHITLLCTPLNWFFPCSVLKDHVLSLLAEITHLLRDYKADPNCLSTKTDNIFKVCSCLRESNKGYQGLFSLKFKQDIPKVRTHDQLFKIKAVLISKHFQKDFLILTWFMLETRNSLHAR